VRKGVFGLLNQDRVFGLNLPV